MHSYGFGDILGTGAPGCAGAGEHRARAAARLGLFLDGRRRRETPRVAPARDSLAQGQGGTAVLLLFDIMQKIHPVIQCEPFAV
jgi:hypothetical protein